MRLMVLKERRPNETRVAATPETVRKLVILGLTVTVEAGAGAGASIPDADFAAAGADIAADARAGLDGAGIIFAVQPPEDLGALSRGALLVCIAGAMADRDSVGRYAQAGIDVAAMELLPRITRAQSMDVLSSQANLAGYRAVIDGAGAFDRGFPMMMTAAGTVPPARVFVVGAGVAGLQAIATARRLGAIVSATDVRPAAKEEIKSLGASFVGVENTETATQTGAYAREMSEDFRRKQAELMTATVAKNDMVICTALVQGGRAPVLVTQRMVDGMKPGSVVVDLASDGGGNCEATRPGEAYTNERGVKILGYRNWPGRIPVAASSLYAKNLLTFLTSFWDKDAKAPRLPEDDAIVQGVMLTRGGAIVHAAFGPATAGSDKAPPAPSGAIVPAAQAGTGEAKVERVEAPLGEANPTTTTLHDGQEAEHDGGSASPEPTAAGAGVDALAAAAMPEHKAASLAPADTLRPAAMPAAAETSNTTEPTASGIYGEALASDATLLAAGDEKGGGDGTPAPELVAAYGEGLPAGGAEEAGAQEISAQEPGALDVAAGLSDASPLAGPADPARPRGGGKRGKAGSAKQRSHHRAPQETHGIPGSGDHP